MPNKYTKSLKTDSDIIHITKRSFFDFGEQQTLTYLNGLNACLQMLADQPERGKTFVHNQTQQPYMFYRYMSHVIYYQQRPHDIFIIRILHVRMLPEKHL